MPVPATDFVPGAEVHKCKCVAVIISPSVSSRSSLAWGSSATRNDGHVAQTPHEDNRQQLNFGDVVEGGNGHAGQAALIAVAAMSGHRYPTPGYRPETGRRGSIQPRRLQAPERRRTIIGFCGMRRTEMPFLPGDRQMSSSFGRIPWMMHGVRFAPWGSGRSSRAEVSRPPENCGKSDHCWRHLPARVAELQVIPEELASDHRPVFAVFEFAAGAVR